MAYYSLHAYDADVRIPEFRGIDQSSEIAYDLRFAAEAENVETPRGVLQPQAGYTVMSGNVFEDNRIETLAQFHRRWYTSGGSKNWLIAAVGGKLYHRQSGSNIDWTEIDMPSGLTSFRNNVWSWVTYEQPYTYEDPSTHEQATITIDVLLISNPDDGMFMVTPPDRPSTWRDALNNQLTWEPVEGETWRSEHSARWTIIDVDTRADPDDPDEEPKKFGFIERYAERIWATAVNGEPDMLVYSRPYKPTDWSAPGDEEQPEDGAGDILQPSWDGASFFALKRFGDQLLAFKNNKVWRVLGVSPGEFQMVEQYGGGTKYPNTIIVDTEMVLMATDDGLSVYDGASVKPFSRPAIEKLWRTVNRDAMDQMCAVKYKERYYFSIPINGSVVNNALLVYNKEDGSFLLNTDTYIETMLPTDDTLYATSSSLPGQVLVMHYDSWEMGVSSGKTTKWATPWMDFNYKTIAKGGFEVYFSPEVKGYPVTFRFTIETEKKSKSKVVTIQPTTFKQKQKRIRFGGTSRRFRLIIETMQSPTNAVWRFTGGIHMVVETDPD